MRLVRAGGALTAQGVVSATAVCGWLGLAGCGVIGPPIPPENVGVNPIIERQLVREGLLAPNQSVWGNAARPTMPSGVTIVEGPTTPDVEAVPLPTPSLREMGTR